MKSVSIWLESPDSRTSVSGLPPCGDDRCDASTTIFVRCPPEEGASAYADRATASIGVDGGSHGQLSAARWDQGGGWVLAGAARRIAHRARRSSGAKLVQRTRTVKPGEGRCSRLRARCVDAQSARSPREVARSGDFRPRFSVVRRATSPTRATSVVILSRLRLLAAPRRHAEQTQCTPRNACERRLAAHDLELARAALGAPRRGGELAVGIREVLRRPSSSFAAVCTTPAPRALGCPADRVHVRHFRSVAAAPTRNEIRRTWV
jgi:hypothetical protein